MIKAWAEFLQQDVVKGMGLDSRLIQPGDVFVAMSGAHQDGRAFIQQAIAKGAVAVLMEPHDQIRDLDLKVPIFKIAHLKDHIAEIAATFFQTPLNEIDFIGVTGTKGKTTTTQWITHFLDHAPKRCGVIGTLGYGFLNQLALGTHTTPDPVSLHRQIQALYAQQARCIVMEVSSHALSQARIEGLRFQTSVFTNLGHDHLDYHGTQAAYLRAKEKLFEQYTTEHAVFNIDDPIGRQLFERYQQNASWVAHPVSLSALKKCEMTPNGIRAEIDLPVGQGLLEAPILGEFNLYNLLTAMTVAALQGVPFEIILEKAKSLPPVPGRMEWFCEPYLPQVVVDYAHTPEALKLVLQTLRQHCSGALWCVFGCGGDRDRNKRPKMAEIAEALSDQVILTQDNSRTEDPEQILSDLCQGAKQPDQFHIECDRTQAIHWAIQKAKPQDCILVAGKGHEPYLFIQGKRIPYQDRTVVLSALADRKKRHV